MHIHPCKQQIESKIPSQYWHNNDCWNLEVKNSNYYNQHSKYGQFFSNKGVLMGGKYFKGDYSGNNPYDSRTSNYLNRNNVQIRTISAI
jgi:hypothetical protein